MAYIVAQTYWDSEEQLVDAYEIWETLEEAQLHYSILLDKDSLYCAAITKVMDATEPPWMDDVSDDQTDAKENHHEI